MSCEIGAVRLTEAVPALAGRDGVVDLDYDRTRASDRARGARADRGFPPVERLAFVGGTDDDRRRRSAGNAHEDRPLRADARRPAASARAPVRHAVQRAQGDPGHQAAARRHSAGRHHRARNGARHRQAATARIGTAADLLLGFLLQQRDAAARFRRPRIRQQRAGSRRAPRADGKLAAMEDQQIHDHIEELVAEEHRLLEHGDRGNLTAGDDRSASKKSSAARPLLGSLTPTPRAPRRRPRPRRRAPPHRRYVEHYQQ